MTQPGVLMAKSFHRSASKEGNRSQATTLL